MTDELKQAIERLGTDLDKGNIPFPFNSHIRTVLDALSTARRDAFEEAAIHLEGRRTVFMRDAAAAIRALADIPALTCVSPDDKSDSQTSLSVEGDGQVADTRQVVAFVRNATALLELNAKGATTPCVPGLAVELLQQAIGLLTTHPAPVDAERIREAAQDVINQAFDFYKKRNGHLGSIEGDDGEKCWIVPFDAFEGLRAALRKQEAGG